MGSGDRRLAGPTAGPGLCVSAPAVAAAPVCWPVKLPGRDVVVKLSLLLLKLWVPVKLPSRNKLQLLRLR